MSFRYWEVQMRLVAACALTALALMLLPSPAAAQGVSVRGTVLGDSSGAVANALVTFEGDAWIRQARTNTAGEFGPLTVPGGSYELRVNAIGFAPLSMSLTAASDTDLVIRLRPAARNLDVVVVSATRTGVYGAVGDLRTLKPLAGAEVQVVGAREATTTDSAGRFSLPRVVGGRKYVVRIIRDGYATRTVPIEVPPKSGYELGVFLDSAASSSHRMDGVWRDFDSRVHQGGFTAVLVPSTELGPNPRGDALTSLLRARSLLMKDLRFHPAALSDPTDPSYPCIWVNGHEMPHGWSLNALSVDDILAFEVYGLNSPQDRSLKATRGDVKPVEGIPPCGIFRGSASLSDAAPSRTGRSPTAPSSAPQFREINPRMMIGSIVVWLRQ
jgi:Carboxypeptidase regulatory-like domain